VVRWDSGVVRGSVIGTDFDPMLAKVIAFGPTRAEASGRLALALERLHIGGVVTNRDFLVATLRTPEFLAGDTTTDFIERVRPPRRLELPADELARAAQCAALWIQGENRANAPVLAGIPSGWRNARMPRQNVVFESGGAELRVAYRSLRDGRFEIECGTGGERQLARIHAWEPDAIDVEIDGRRTRALVTRAGERLVVHGPRGDVELLVAPRFVIPGRADTQGGFAARMPGRVIDVRVRAGDAVRAGQTLLVLEAMKMEHPVWAPFAGRVSHLACREGQQVAAGELLLELDAAAS
jgi:propionyl-CoA carboxylase alpha chain